MVTKTHEALSQLIPTALADPTASLISPTNDKQGTALATDVTDVKNDVIAGRKTMADFDAAVASWRKKGGDKIRGEFESVLSKAAAPTTGATAS
jgi:putative aldouronate transport system substrate-binding protein